MFQNLPFVTKKWDKKEEEEEIILEDFNCQKREKKKRKKVRVLHLALIEYSQKYRIVN